jgi:hypothetical protein
MNKNFFKKSIPIFVLLFTVTLIFQPASKVYAKTPAANTKPTTTSIKPVFSSSFIQYWYAQDWDEARWMDEFTMLQNIGINEIILQDVADTKSLYTSYITSLPGYTPNNVDMLENALSAADKIGMHVRVGLGFNNDWWNKNASDSAWLNTEASKNKDIFNEILQKYGTHPSLTGWYIPYEFSQLTATTFTAKSNLNSFLKQIGNEIRLKDSRNIMISPYYNYKYSFLFSLSGWTTTLTTVLKDTKIDIVALQDGVGAGYTTLNQVSNIFSYTKKATNVLGIKLYADTETYTYTSNINYSAPQSRITSQLSLEKTYVQGFVAFSIDHYQSIYLNQEQNYNDYYNYYLANK